MTFAELTAGCIGREALETAGYIVRVIKKHVHDRRGVVIALTYALRAALDELSPDERTKGVDMITEWLK